MVYLTDIARLRDELIKARLSGVREFTDQNGERVRYATDAEMVRAIADADRRLGAALPTSIRFSTSKGL